eukprot:3530352-Prorocentrum_lima.AAC.1
MLTDELEEKMAMIMMRVNISPIKLEQVNGIFEMILRIKSNMNDTTDVMGEVFNTMSDETLTQLNTIINT